MPTSRFIMRLWYYFRLGYSTYMTFLLGYVSTLVTVYYLAIKNLPNLLDLFPKFIPFALLATTLGAPLAVVLGWLHMKRSSAFAAEAEIGMEANPWYYKIPHGYNQEVVFPLYLEIVKEMKSHTDDPTDITRLSKLETKIQTLIDGGYVGKPKRSM